MKARNSNIEFLRLMCIVMIISMHVFGHFKDQLDTSGYAALSFNNAVCNLGVSIFMLISGYYGIRYKTEKLLSLWNIALFWSFALIFVDTDHSAKHLIRSVFPVLTNKYWFLTSYVIIFCLAPYIEKLISVITRQQFRVLIVIMLLFFVIAPSFLMLEIMRDSGKGVMNMLTVYLLGRYYSIYGLPKRLSGVSGGGHFVYSHYGDNCHRFSCNIKGWHTLSDACKRQLCLNPSWCNYHVHNSNEDEATHNRLVEPFGRVRISYLCDSRRIAHSDGLCAGEYIQYSLSDGLGERHNHHYDSDSNGICSSYASEQNVPLAAQSRAKGGGNCEKEDSYPPSRSHRIDWLDIAKGLGIIAVVISHSKCSNLIWIVMPCYVPVFFVCSGFTLKQKSDYSDFMIKKTKRLLLPYLFCMVFIISFNYLSGIILHQPFGFFRSTVGVLYSRTMLFPIDTEVNYLMLPMNTQPMWFLTALFASLLIAYPLIGQIKQKLNMLITAFMLIVLSYLFTFSPILLPWSFDTLPLFVLMILFGFYIRERNLIIKMPWYTHIIILMVYVTILYFNGKVNFSIREYGASLLMAAVTALLGSLLLIKLSQMIAQIQWLNKPLSSLGRHSLYIMCFHLPVLTACGKLIETLHFSGTILYLLYLSSVFIAICIGYLLSVLVKTYIPILH